MRTAPSVASYSRGIRLMRVVLPQPVLPMKAVVSPGLAVKVMSRSTSCSAPGYLKDTWSNSMVQGASLRTGWGCSGSRICTGLSRISEIRPADTEARGRMMKTMEIIIKLIMICTAYCIKAIMLPTSATLAAERAAIHTTTRDTPFITMFITGIISEMVRLTNRWFWVRSRLAASKRFSSWASVLKARMTIRPERRSRATRFSRSSSFCARLNRGMTTIISTTISEIITTRDTAMVATMPGMLVALAWARRMPPMPMMGA